MFKNNNFYNLLIKIAFIVFVLSLTAITLYFSFDRYNNYVYGKFDLGNMNQMLYNSARGDFMILTDYFGDNTPRWSMSHVDPSLLIFIPVSLIYSDASILLVSQSLAFAASAFLIYLIAKREGLNTIESSLIGAGFMLFPITGYILVWTTFHSLVLAIPFLLLALLIMLSYNATDIQKNYKFNKISISAGTIKLLFVYVCIILVVLSKEELGFIVAFLTPFFVYKFPKLKKHLLVIAFISFIWSIIAFFVLIPAYSHSRSVSLHTFIDSIGGVADSDFTHLDSDNYFLYRYQELGSSYGEIIKNIFLKPGLFLKLLFSSDNMETLNKLMLPALYSLFFVPLLLVAALPELLIQMLAADTEIFSITNHRLAIVIPFLSLSVIYIAKRLKRFNRYFSYLYLSLMVIVCLVTSYFYQNPLVYPFYAKAYKFITFKDSSVYAQNATSIEFNNDIRKICADSIIKYLNKSQKVSVPQPLGAKTSNKYYNALFPAGLDTADLIVTDIYDRKLVDFLELDTKYNKIAVKRLIKDTPIALNVACDRFFVLEKTKQDTDSLGSIIPSNTEFDDYIPILTVSKFYKFNYELKDNNIVYFEYFYSIGDEEYRNSLFAYTIITNGRNDWTFVHFPSFYITELGDWPVEAGLKESFTLQIPDFLPKGDYDVYFGIGNRVNNEENVKIGVLEI